MYIILYNIQTHTRVYTLNECAFIRFDKTDASYTIIYIFTNFSAVREKRVTILM